MENLHQTRSTVRSQNCISFSSLPRAAACSSSLPWLGVLCVSRREQLAAGVGPKALEGLEEEDTGAHQNVVFKALFFPLKLEKGGRYDPLFIYFF